MELTTLTPPTNTAQLSDTVYAVVGVLAIIALIIVLIVWFKLSKNMARIAADKGYPERRWFHYCFWLGIPGILMVCAMPDKNRR